MVEANSKRYKSVRKIVDCASLYTDPQNEWIAEVFELCTPHLGGRPTPKTITFSTDGADLKRGYGVSVVCFGLGYGDGFPDASRARCKLTADGMVEVYSSGIDVGQGLINMVAQIVAALKA